ncbi:hypothetical protein CYMTET_3318 [Cymbomonas tetramitiformis]|uniref:Uncharacterized protein n=1 Tax=Cymbomonas tetramitiformis TaxID=36881 RepID=A0AAE0H3I2_9CHLO|nr:hypothetical protein CYMTET_3318 [Cymbomonas tetramitiformis]
MIVAYEWAYTVHGGEVANAEGGDQADAIMEEDDEDKDEERGGACAERHPAVVICAYFAWMPVFMGVQELRHSGLCRLKVSEVVEAKRANEHLPPHVPKVDAIKKMSDYSNSYWNMVSVP